MTSPPPPPPTPATAPLAPLPAHRVIARPAAPAHLLADLTEPQRQAVLTTEGPLLVLAGPGSGKTRVVTRRIAHLVGMGVKPWRILAVTFTNKAAAEMRHRVEHLLGEAAVAQGLTVTTFHSLCVRLLRRYGGLAEQAGCPVVKPGFGIYDADDQTALLKKVLETLQLSTSNWPPRTVLAAISNAKNDLLDAGAFAQTAGDFYTRQIAKVYEKYESALKAAGAVDFDDLLMLTAKMLKLCEPVRTEVKRRYRYLMVDEYQDTNKAQLAIVSMIAGEDPGAGAGENAARPNICVVGDPDQSIYGWRGADIANILEFEEQFPSAKTIALGENFRSLAPILTAADRLIRHNHKRKHKPLLAMRKGGEGTTVEVVVCRDEHHEAHLVLDYLKARKESGLAWKDMAVFYRNNSLSRVMEDALRSAHVPYVLVRGTAFFQREEVKNLLAYLRLAANPADVVSLERIVNTPARGISDPTFEKIEGIAAQRGMSVYDTMRNPALLSPLLARAQGSVAKFIGMVEGWTGNAPEEGFMGSAASEGEQAAPIGALAALVERVVRESGLEQMYSKEEERNENLAEVVSSAREFEESFRSGAVADAGPGPVEGEDPFGGIEGEPAEGEQTGGEPTAGGEDVTLLDLLRAYLERVALVADTDAIDPETGAVTLMTLHAAKGLEYKVVSLIGLEEGLLPHSRSQENENALEEERRLCFVGITRAMDSIMLSAANYRTIRGLSERQITSRFVDELRGEGVTISNQGDPLGFDDDERDEGMREFLGGGAARLGGGRTGEFGDSKKIVSKAAGASQSAEWSIGMTVRHPQFGIGKIEAVSGGADARVRVKFGIGVKTLVLQYARLTPA